VLDLDESVPRYVVGDPTRVRQVFLNIVGNAVRFTYNGEVVVRVRAEPARASGTRTTPVQLSQNDRWCVHVDVIDTGVGISAERAAILFRANGKVPARRAGDTGLGLTVCGQLCYRMSGALGIMSRGPNMGTMCSFSLQLARSTTGHEQPCIPSRQPSIRLLLAMPNSSVAPIASAWAQRLQFSCALVHSWEDCCRRANAEAFDMIVVHSRIANVPLVELLPQLKLVAAARVVAVADCAFRGVGHELRQAGVVVSVVEPPLRFTAFATALQRAARGVTLPSNPASPAPLSACPATRYTASPQPSRSAPVRILLADDNRVSRHVLRMMLRRLGMTTVDEVGDGNAALQHIVSGQYDAVLLDLHMPHMGGEAVATTVRRTMPAAPAIIAHSGDLTWNGDPTLFDAFLVKPVRLEQLASALSAHVPDLHIPLSSSDRTGRTSAPPVTGL
jgi:CheY-like chemotaxis protein